MTLTDVIADQHRLPRGALAPLAARSLNRRNDALIRRCIDALGVVPTDHVLDVGFGGALSLRLLLRERGHDKVYGIDPSGEMVRRAGRLLPREVESGRLVLRRGAVDAIPFGDGSFDGVLTCQTVYFWADVAAGLTELYRVLAPGGRCVVAMMPRLLQEHFGFAGRGYNVLSHDELGHGLEGTGFVDVAPSAPAGAGDRWVVIARKPADAALPACAESRTIHLTDEKFWNPRYIGARSYVGQRSG